MKKITLLAVSLIIAFTAMADGIVYFKNTLGWENVYVCFYENTYWDNEKGSGSWAQTATQMTLVEGKTDIFQCEYTGTFKSISFIKDKQDNTEDKENSYTILRWMMREFGFLKNKDNLDVSTKRPRMADEYLPSIYAMKLSRGIYRISDKGKNVTFKDVTRVIDTPPTFIINNINATNLIDYVNLVNDNDAELALSYTYKGISGLGDQGSGTAVPLIYRSVHPSHLGRIDLDSSSASDPGLSGTICPTAKIYGDTFTDYQEPNGWRDFYNEMIDNFHNLHGMVQTIELQKKLGLHYDYVKEDMVKETIETYRKLIPVFIDLDGKKDYTLGAILVDEQPVILSDSDDEDGIGTISAVEDDMVSDDSDE